MTSVLQSLERTLAAGLVLVIAIVVISGMVTGHWIRGDFAWWTFVARWLHIMSGIMWVGLLWYLNFVQIPTMPKIEPVEHRAALTKYITPGVLFWFRYGALSTVVTGLLLAWMKGFLWTALSLQKSNFGIGVGMWLALLMAYNVWFIIWPNQQRALGLVEATPEAKAKSARIAMLVSRVNTMLSVPMLYCMAASSNGGL